MSNGLENAYTGKPKKTYVLDASAFMLGGIEFQSESSYTTESVVNEVKANVIQKSRVEGLIASNVLKICLPQGKYIDLVLGKAAELGEATSLSKTDIELLALALELSSKGLDVTIISDDYSVQNVAGSLGLKWSGIKYTGITRVIHWKMICESCKYETYDARRSICPNCGAKMKRKPAIKNLKS